jgi:hypothetical protein
MRKSKAAKMVNELLESSSSKTKKKAAPKAKRGSAEKTGLPATGSAMPAASAEAENTYIVIDYPTEGELISGLAYAIRIGASESGKVELSFNGGEWQPCRAGAGYWWFDWGYYEPGTYKIVARLVDDNGKVIKKSDARKVQVA